MTTEAQVIEAELASRRQRLRNAELLEVDESLVRDEDRKLIERFFETAKGEDGGEAFDRALAYPLINQLYLRGVIKIKETKCS